MTTIFATPELALLAGLLLGMGIGGIVASAIFLDWFGGDR